MATESSSLICLEKLGFWESSWYVINWPVSTGRTGWAERTVLGCYRDTDSSGAISGVLTFSIEVQ